MSLSELPLSLVARNWVARAAEKSLEALVPFCMGKVNMKKIWHILLLQSDQALVYCHDGANDWVAAASLGPEDIDHVVMDKCC